MAKRKRNGQFVKTKTHHRGASRARSTTTAIVVAAPRTMSRPRPRIVYTKKKHHARRGRGKHAGLNIKTLAIAGAGLAFLTSASSPIQAIPNAVNKIPGAKTFGATTMAGAACLAINHFKPNKWLKAAGWVGVIAGALQVGAKGTDFKWVGDASNEFSGDIDAE